MRLHGHFPGFISLLFLSTSLNIRAQLTTDELAPLLAGLSANPFENRASDPLSLLEKRVPLMTDDPTIAPLVDLQVFAPPVVPKGGQSCDVVLLKHTFGDGSYNAPVVVDYVPPTDKNCGEVGHWAAISLNLSVYSIGTQYDRLGAIYLSHTEIWRTSSAEPTKTGTIWNTIKDVTHYTPIFAQKGDLMMDFSNIIATDLLLDGEFNVIITATFYAPTLKFPTPSTSDIIIPLSNLSPTLPNFFAVADDNGATVQNVTLPENAVEAYVEIYCSGNSAEEFWYLNTPDEFLNLFPSDSEPTGKGPFREVQVIVDDKLAGVVWPHAVIYTGGITPSNWRPLTAYGAYDAPTYWIDITPFIPMLLEEGIDHSITLKVLGQGTDPSINSNWFVSGSVHVRKGKEGTRTTGQINTYSVPDTKLKTVGGTTGGNDTVWTKVEASRSLRIEGVLETGHVRTAVSFVQELRYVNEAVYVDEGWVQWGNQTTDGTVVSQHGGVQVLRDAFTYDLSVFSNYTLYTAQFGGYGSDIHQTFTRALASPTSSYKSIHSDQHAEGWIGMDDWPGLRHAINGTGSTKQTFAYVDGRGQTYFRDIQAKNDGWVKDDVWGTLRDANPPVPREQIFGPKGGPGFRRTVIRR